MKQHTEKLSAINTATKIVVPVLAFILFCTIVAVAQQNHPNVVQFSVEDNATKTGDDAAFLSTSFVEMGKPAGGHPTITDMVVFNGKLYFTTSKDPLGNWGTNVFYTTDGISYTKVLEDNSSQGYLRLGVYDSKLWVPDGDPNGLDPSYVYISSTGAPASFTKTSILQAVHTFDVIKYNNKLLTSNGMSTYQGGLCKYNGTSQWNSVYQSPSSFRMKYMVEFMGKLIVANSNPNSDTDYFIWNGDVETTAPALKNAVTGSSATFRWYASSQGRIYWTVASNNQIRCLTSTDGNTWTPVANLDGKFVSDYCELNGKMYALSQNGLWESSDYVNFQQIATPPSSYPNAFMPVPVASGGYNADGMASMEPFNGSIWCGSSLNGKLYKVDVATAVPEVKNDMQFEKISPNPFSASASFYIAAPLVNASMTIYDSFGRALKTVEGINGNSFTVNRDDLPIGFYYVQLMQQGRMIAADKIIITD